MIIGYILDIFYRFLSFIIGLFPSDETGLPIGFTNGINLIVTYLHNFSWLLPVDTLLSAVITVISFYIAILIIKSILWIIRTIRGSGS